MLQRILEYVTAHPEANSFHVCEAFGLPRAMAERFLGMLEDAGHFALEAPSSGCSSGGCSSGGCSTGGCGASSAIDKLTALAREARERQATSA